MKAGGALRLDECVAAVTLYKPTAEILRRLLAGLRADGISTLLYVDGPTGEAIEDGLLQELKALPMLAILQAERNAGIGRALNQLAACAVGEKRRCVFLLDQDSDLPSGLLAALLDSFERARRSVAHLAAIAPRPVAPRNEAIKPPRYRRRRTPLFDAGALSGVDFLITSGSLVSLEAWLTVGPFREDYFIDAIDAEWCFRARSSGYEIVLAEALEFPHRIGTGVVRFGPLSFPKQSERRMLTYVRNQMHMLRLRHVPIRWKARTLLYLPLQIIAVLASQAGRPGRLRRFAAAARDGIRGRLGPPGGVD